MKSVVLVSEAPLCIQGRSEAYRRTLKITSSHVFSCKSCYKATKLSKGRSSTGTPELCSRASPSASRPSTVTHAQGRRRPVDDDVDLDDEEYFDDAQAWGVVGGFTERLADVAYDYVPDSVSRSTVVLAVRAASVLLLIGFARSILGFVFTVGTVVLGLFVASKVLGQGPGAGGQERGSSSKSQRWGSGGGRGSRAPGSRTRRRPPRQLPSGVTKDADVLDVWFERKEQEEERRR